MRTNMHMQQSKTIDMVNYDVDKCYDVQKNLKYLCLRKKKLKRYIKFLILISIQIISFIVLKNKIGYWTILDKIRNLYFIFKHLKSAMALLN